MRLTNVVSTGPCNVYNIWRFEHIENHFHLHYITLSTRMLQKHCFKYNNYNNAVKCMIHEAFICYWLFTVSQTISQQMLGSRHFIISLSLSTSLTQWRQFCRTVTNRWAFYSWQGNQPVSVMWRHFSSCRFITVTL